MKLRLNLEEQDHAIGSSFTVNCIKSFSKVYVSNVRATQVFDSLAF